MLQSFRRQSSAAARQVTGGGYGPTSTSTAAATSDETRPKYVRPALGVDLYDQPVKKSRNKVPAGSSSRSTVAPSPDAQLQQKGRQRSAYLGGGNSIANTSSRTLMPSDRERVVVMLRESLGKGVTEMKSKGLEALIRVPSVESLLRHIEGLMYARFKNTPKVYLSRARVLKSNLDPNREDRTLTRQRILTLSFSPEQVAYLSSPSEFAPQGIVAMRQRTGGDPDDLPGPKVDPHKKSVSSLPSLPVTATKQKKAGATLLTKTPLQETNSVATRLLSLLENGEEEQTPDVVSTNHYLSTAAGIDAPSAAQCLLDLLKGMD